MSPEMINAIVGLWKPIIALAILLFVIFQRKPLQDFLKRFVSARYKHGDTEFSLDAEKADAALPAYDVISVENTKISDDSETEEIQEQISSETEKGDWFGNMLSAFNEGNLEAAKKALEIGQLAELDAHSKLRYQIIFYYFQFTKLSDSKALDELEKLTLQDGVQSLAFFWLSECYQHRRSYDKAKEYLELSLEHASSDQERADRVGALVDLILEIDDSNANTETFDIAIKTLKEVDKTFQSPIYQALAKVYEKYDNKLLRAIALEKALETSPNNSDLFFNAAYAQTHVNKLSTLALVNYDTVLRIQPKNSMATNNLGVLADELKMPIKSTELYQQSSENENTLAMANLAYKLLGKGFIDEAEEIISKAQEQQDVHSNIAAAASKIMQNKEAEREKWEALINLGIKQKTFLQNFAEARFNYSEKPKTFNGRWKFENTSLEIKETNGNFISIWGEGSSRQKLTGEVKGETAEVTLKKTSSWNKETFDSGNSGLCYLSPDRKKIHIMILDKENPAFLELWSEDV